MFKISKKKVIIITGSNGYIGSNLVKYFSKIKKYKIICFINKKKNQKITSKNIKYIKHDLMNKIPENKINEKIDAVLHFAGPKNDRKFVNENKKKILQGLKIDQNMIKFSIKKKIKLFIYASSAAVYDLKEGNKKNPFREENVRYSSSYDGVYGYTKKKTENYLNKLSNKNFKSVSCRIFSIYGKNSNTIINLWKRDIKKGKKINIWGKKQIIRSWLHIDDLLTAIHALLEKKYKFKAVNIGSDEITSLEMIIKLISRKYKKKYKINYIQSNYPGPLVRYSSQKKLKKLGWTQKINLKKGLDLI